MSTISHLLTGGLGFALGKYYDNNHAEDDVAPKPDDPGGDPPAQESGPDIVQMIIAGVKVTGISEYSGMTLGVSSGDYDHYSQEQLSVIASYLANRLQLMDSIFKGDLTVPNQEVLWANGNESEVEPYFPVPSDNQVSFDPALSATENAMSAFGFAGAVNAMTLEYISKHIGDSVSQAIEIPGESHVYTPPWCAFQNGSTDENNSPTRMLKSEHGSLRFGLLVDPQSELFSILSEQRKMSTGGFSLTSAHILEIRRLMKKSSFIRTKGIEIFNCGHGLEIGGVLTGDPPSVPVLPDHYMPSLFVEPSRQVLIRSLDQSPDSISEPLTSQEILLAMVLVSGMQSQDNPRSLYEAYMASSHLPSREIWFDVQYLVGQSSLKTHYEVISESPDNQVEDADIDAFCDELERLLVLTETNDYASINQNNIGVHDTNELVTADVLSDAASICTAQLAYGDVEYPVIDGLAARIYS